MTWIKWCVFALAALWALSTNLTVRSRYKTSATPILPANTFALGQALSVIGVLVLHRSPFHLLWLFPCSYLAGFFSLRSKVVAFLPWLYGYFLAYTIPSNW
jgi:hypothetical protein